MTQPGAGREAADGRSGADRLPRPPNAPSGARPRFWLREILARLRTPALRRFAGRSLLGLMMVIVAGATFTILLALVVQGWPPLRALDLEVAARWNALVSGAPLAVSALRLLTGLGGSPATWLLPTVTMLWLVIRRQPRLAAYVAVTGLGGAVLAPVVKELVGRARPMVPVVVAPATGDSFPSGHALGSTVAYGVLLLVFLPAVPARARGPLVVAVAALVAAIGCTRIALGVHYLSDVLAGWFLGLAWLGVTGAAFARWRREAGLRVVSPIRGLAPEARPALLPAPEAQNDPLPDPWRTTAQLLVAWVLLLAILAGVGLLVAEVLAGRFLLQLDRAAVQWFVSVRDPVLTELMNLGSRLGSTVVIVSVLAVATPLVLAVTRRWRPALFLLVVMAGEVSLFLATARLIGRSRPDVTHLGPQLPPTSSFPSGHMAAATAMYGALALLVLAGTRDWRGWLATGWAVAASVLVATARLYRGVHFPTDILAGAFLGLSWLAASWWVIRPSPRDHRIDVRPEPDEASGRHGLERGRPGP